MYIQMWEKDQPFSSCRLGGHKKVECAVAGFTSHLIAVRLIIVRAHVILPQVPCRVSDEISLQGSARPDARAYARNHPADMRWNGRPYCKGCVGAWPCPHVPVDPAETVAVGRHAAHQGAVFTTYPEMEFPELRKRYWDQRFWARGYFSTTSGNVTDDIIMQYPGITFRQMMLPASAGSPSLVFLILYQIHPLSSQSAGCLGWFDSRLRL